jgi:lipid-A-disaccharide synthase
MDVMVVAGEASGDQHAADVVAALKAQRHGLSFFGMGGPKLAAQGVELVHGAHEISVMGFVEVLPKLPRIIRVMGDLTAAARARRPACAILVDVPDFNLPLARRLKRLGIPIVWYIAPMVWAWRTGRVKALAEVVDRLLCILPFEEAFLRERGVDATYVGSPVVEQVPPLGPPERFRSALGLLVQRPVLAVLPGSRRSELARLLPVLVEVAARVVAARPGIQVVVPVAPGLERALVAAPFATAGVPVQLIDGRAPEVVAASEVAVVASGTATLEAGLMARPLVAVYRMSPLSYGIGRALVKIPYFCLVNLLAGERVVPELLQGDATPERIIGELEPLWADGPARRKCLEGLARVRTVLGPKGAAARAAGAVGSVLDRAIPRSPA